MKKRIITTAVSGMLILSLTACSINPLDWFSKNGGNEDIAKAASTINKEAVYKETDSFTIPGWDWIENIQSANGKMYAVTCAYDYPEYNYPEGDIDFAKEPIVYDGEIVGDPLVDDTQEGETDIVIEDEVSDPMMPAVIEDEADFYPEEIYGPEKVEMKIASFTNASDIEEISFEIDTEMNYQGTFCIDNDGNYYVVMSKYIEDGNNYSEEFYLWKVSPEGTIEKEALLFSNSGDEWNWISQILCDKDGNVYVASDRYVDIFASADLSKLGRKEMVSENAYSQGLSRILDGSVVASIYEWTETDSKYTIERINTNGTSEVLPLGDIIGYSSIVNGVGYDICYMTNSSIIGINVNDKEGTEIVNFYDSDIAFNTYSNYFFSDINTFYALSYGNNGTEIAKFEKVPADQVVDKVVITIGADYLDYSISKHIMDYNKQNDKYKVKLVDYSQFNTGDDYQAGEKRLNSDLATGQGPDIVSLNSYRVLNLMEKGVFEDLTPYMENGNGIKKSDLVYNAQNLYADGDKLYCVYPYFSVGCCTINKDNYKENMTLEDLINWEQATGNKAYESDYTRSSIMYQYLYYGMDAFLDVKTGKCSFDSPEFVKLLEYANTYPETIEDEFYDFYSYDSYINQFRENKVLLSMTTLYGFRDDFRDSYLKMNGNGIPCKLPIEGSEGTCVTAGGIMGINAKSDKKEAAWDFIASCFTDEFYEEESIYSYASVESVLDKQIEESKERLYWIDENGEKVYYDDSVWLESGELIIPPVTDEYAQMLKEFITTAMGVSFYDDEINNIIDEECQSFFSGQKSAKEVASVVQSRVQIYVNEKQ